MPIMCQALFQVLEIHQNRQKKISGLMERQYILVGVTGNKQTKLLINYMIYYKVTLATGKQGKGDWECGVGASCDIK